MLEACAHRRFRPQGRPVDNVAYVFLLETDARRHLRDLWLRGLEVRAIIDGREVRLDDRYESPPHVPPAWVDGRRPDASVVTTAQPVYDRSHDHCTIDAILAVDPRGYVLPDASAGVLDLVARVEALRPALHARADRLHDALGADPRHDAAPPEIASAIAAFRTLLCPTWRAAVPRRGDPGAETAIAAVLGGLHTELG
jgi:hypothetical protein